jgi:hypothetical protein
VIRRACLAAIKWSAWLGHHRWDVTGGDVGVLAGGVAEIAAWNVYLFQR